MNTPKGSLGPLRFCIPSSEDYVLTSVTVVQPVLDHHIKSIIHSIFFCIWGKENVLIPGMLILRLLPGLCILSHIKMPNSGSKPTQLCRVHW